MLIVIVLYCVTLVFYRVNVVALFALSVILWGLMLLHVVLPDEHLVRRACHPEIFCGLVVIFGASVIMGTNKSRWPMAIIMTCSALIGLLTDNKTIRHVTGLVAFGSFVLVTCIQGPRK